MIYLQSRSYYALNAKLDRHAKDILLKRVQRDNTQKYMFIHIGFFSTYINIYTHYYNHYHQYNYVGRL